MDWRAATLHVLTEKGNKEAHVKPIAKDPRRGIMPFGNCLPKDVLEAPGGPVLHVRSKDYFVLDTGCGSH